MLPIRPTNQFKKDLKKAAKQNRNLNMLREVIEKLAIPEPLPPKFQDHN
jgi:addiction module RelE/StbE family toxin